MRWTFHEGELDLADVQDLLRLHFQAMRAASPRDACHVLDTKGLRGPDISFYSLREDGQLLGIGALKRLPGDEGEIKSMRTAPAALGRGVGRAILGHLIGRARAMGLGRVSLETGSGPLFEPAIRLYLREGFAPCGTFAGYPATPFTRFFTRPL